VRRRKICVVTGGRADYGLLYWPMKEIAVADDFELQVVATGMHLAPEFGDTVRRIEEDGFSLSARVEMLLASDSAVGIAKSIGLGLIGFADAFARLAPDLLLVLGDRFEILAAVEAALVARLPVAHLCGGDITEGAYDDAIRHAITKMAHLHFASNEAAAQRLRQMGEDPTRIFTVGSPGIDNIRRQPVMAREDVARETGLDLARPCLLVTYHPTTLGTTAASTELEELLAALDRVGSDMTIAVTLPNADNDGRTLRRAFETFAASRPNVRTFAALGSRLYLNLVRHAAAVVGNSSSGLYEAPSLGTPTVDIGERQQGRLKAASVISCVPERGAIAEAICAALKRGKAAVDNPYGAGDASRRIVEILRGFDDFDALTRKRFVEFAGA
jgi:GDP/UDP-N,N'-diacetylbacillosamine 2-epimerase (hydrolysing)